MREESPSGLVRYSFEWQSGMTVVEPFSLCGSTYLLLVRAEGTAKDGHNIHVLRINENGRLGDCIDARTWTQGFTHARFYEVGGKPFAFFLKEESGLAQCHALGTDATLRNEVAQYLWTSGWTSVELFTHGEETRLVLLKREGIAPSGHNLHILQMEADGRVGKRLDMQSVGEGFTQIKPFVIGNEAFLFMLKSETGFAKIRRIALDGKLGEITAHADWEDVWTIARHFSIKNQHFLLLVAGDASASHGVRARVYPINEQGRLGPPIDGKHLAPGLSHVEPFQVGDEHFVILLNAESGWGHVRKLEQDGKLGEEIG